MPDFSDELPRMSRVFQSPFFRDLTRGFIPAIGAVTPVLLFVIYVAATTRGE